MGLWPQLLFFVGWEKVHILKLILFAVVASLSLESHLVSRNNFEQENPKKCGPISLVPGLSVFFFKFEEIEIIRLVLKMLFVA